MVESGKLFDNGCRRTHCVCVCLLKGPANEHVREVLVFQFIKISQFCALCLCTPLFGGKIHTKRIFQQISHTHTYTKWTRQTIVGAENLINFPNTCYFHTPLMVLFSFESQILFQTLYVPCVCATYIT